MDATRIFNALAQRMLLAVNVRALVIGYGSIGARHTRLLEELGCNTCVLSTRASAHSRTYTRLDQALTSHQPEYVVVANPTAEHHSTLTELATAGFDGIVLIEKPLFSKAQALPDNRFRHVFVGYNLRFHPLLVALRGALDNEQLIAVNAYVGQYLPDWRPGSDYRNSYSASAARGGGVLRDLSHELDYVAMLTGSWTAVSALGGHFSTLDIDSDDVFALLMQTKHCPVVCIQMSYLDRMARRQVVINTRRRTLAADFVSATLCVDGVTTHHPCERDDSYIAMHHAALAGKQDELCSLTAASDTLALIEAAERSAQAQKWIQR